jgi:hypothetical protein
MFEQLKDVRAVGPAFGRRRCRQIGLTERIEKFANVVCIDTSVV